MFTAAIMLSALALAQSEETPEMLPLEVTAMSFNVRFGTADDGPNSWEHRKETLVDTIAYYKPDVLGVQECLEFQAEYIVAELPEYRWFGVGRDADLSGETTAILYRHEKLAPLETGNFWLSESPETPGSVSWDSSLTRMASWAKFQHRQRGHRFAFVNTHFDHRGVEARHQSAKVIAKRLETLPQGLPMLLVGDFNALPDSAPHETLLEAGFKDAWLEAETTEGPESTWSSFMAPDSASKKRIDWILVKGPVEVLSAETVTYNEEGRYPSDHYPVVARLRLRP